MAARNFDNFLITSLSQGIAFTGTGNIYLDVLPTDTNGWLVINPSSTNKREILYYRAKGATYVTVTLAADRGIGGTTAQTHSQGAEVRMNVTAEMLEEYSFAIQPIIKGLVTDAGGLNIAVAAWDGEIGGIQINYAGTVSFAVTDNQTNYVELDNTGTLSSNITGFTAGKKRLATVVAAAADITSITDKRQFQPYTGAFVNSAIAGSGIAVSSATGNVTISIPAGGVNLASMVSGVLPEVNGGTGESSYALGDLLSGNGSGLGKLTAAANGQYLTTDNTQPLGVKWVAVAPGAISVSDEGGVITAAVTSFDFVGAGVTASAVGGAVTITVPGAGATGQDAIQFEDEGVNLGTSGSVTEVDFTGAGVLATRVLNKVTITIPGAVGSGANTSLSNLASVAINTSLLPGSDGAIDLGDGTHQFRRLYLDNSIILQEVGAGTNSITISAPASLPASWGLTLPDNDGSANQVLQTDGAGNTSWVTPLSAPVTVAQGGTGDTSLTAYAVLCGGTVSTNPVQPVAGVGSSGQVLTSNGAAALPTFQPVNANSAYPPSYFMIGLNYLDFFDPANQIGTSYYTDDPSYLAIYTSSAPTIIRVFDAAAGGDHTARDITLDQAGITSIKGTAKIGLFLYVKAQGAANANYIIRYDAHNISAGGTVMTVAGATSFGTQNFTMVTDGVDLYFDRDAGNTVNDYELRKYTISGTTITSGTLITCGVSSANFVGVTMDRKTNFYGYNTGDFKFRRYDNTGTLQATMTTGLNSAIQDTWYSFSGIPYIVERLTMTGNDTIGFYRVPLLPSDIFT